MAKTIETRVVLSGKISPSMVKALTNMQNHLDRTSKKAGMLGKMSDGLGRKLAGAAGVFGGGMLLKAIGGGALEAAASMEAYRSTLNVVMKDSDKAARAMKWAVDFANKTPFETDAVVEAVVKLESYGLTAQKVLPAVGNMAGVMNKDIIQAVEAVADAQTGELERLKEFGITKGQIIEKAGAMFRGIEVVNNKGQIVDQQRFNDALFGLMEDRFKGGMEIQASGWKGIWSTISGVSKSGLAKMMGMTDTGDIRKGSVFDQLKGKAKEFADYLQQLYNSGAMDRIGAGLAGGLETTLKVLDAIVWAGPVIIPIISGLTTGMLAYAAATKGAMIIEGLNKAWQYGSTVMALMREGTRLSTIAQMEFNLAMSANPIGVWCLMIGAAVAAGIWLYNNWDWLTAGIGGFWTERVVPVFQGVGRFFSGVFNGAIGIFKNYVNTQISMANFLIRALNRIQFKTPDWVPGIGGKQFGINIPVIPMFAKGGFSASPAIFGEAGLEAAIPIKRRNPRSLALLNQTARMLGVTPGQGVNLTYAPVITGGDPAAIEQVLAQDKAYLMRIIEEYFRERERVSYGVQPVF